MTLNAEDLLPAQDQLLLERGAMRVVATYTGHHLAIPRISDLLTHGMGKFSLGFMTLRADAVAVLPQHRPSITAVHGVTFVTGLIDCRMDVRPVFIPFKGIFMTSPTHLTLFGSQQPLVVAGMGAVAFCAAVVSIGG